MVGVRRVAMRVCRQMVGVSRVEVAMRDRRVCRQMVGVSRVVSGNERQASMETDGWSQKSCKWQ